MSRRIAAGLSALSLLLHAAISMAMWRHHVVPSWDLGIFSELAKAYSTFSAPIVDIKAAGFNLLGDHFHPLLIVLGPLWRLFPSGLTLLLTQSVLFALSTYPLVRLAVTRLGRAPGILLGASYVLSWGLIEASWSQFHEIAFAVPLIAWGLTWWVEGKRVPATVAMALLPFIKEDLGLTVAAFALAIYLRDRARAHAAFAAAWGVAWFLLATKVILPALNPHGTWDYTDNLSLAAQLTQGWIAKAFTLALLLLACGIIGMRSPFILMLAPTLAWRFLGNVEYYWGPTMHYSAVLIPICAAALIDALPAREPAILPASQAGVKPTSTGPADSADKAEVSRRGTGMAELRLIACGAALAASLIMLPAGHAKIIWTAPAYDWHPEGVIAAAASHDAVAADTTLLAYLVPHIRVFWYGTTRQGDVDAVAITAQTAGGDAAKWAADRWGGRWRVEYEDRLWQLAVRYR